MTSDGEQFEHMRHAACDPMQQAFMEPRT